MPNLRQVVKFAEAARLPARFALDRVIRRNRDRPTSRGNEMNPGKARLRAGTSCVGTLVTIAVAMLFHDSLQRGSS